MLIKMLDENGELRDRCLIYRSPRIMCAMVYEKRWYGMRDPWPDISSEGWVKVLLEIK